MDKLDVVIQQFGEFTERTVDDLIYQKNRADRLDSDLHLIKATLERIEKMDTIAVEDHEPIYGKFALVARKALRLVNES